MAAFPYDAQALPCREDASQRFGRASHIPKLDRAISHVCRLRQRKPLKPNVGMKSQISTFTMSAENVTTFGAKRCEHDRRFVICDDTLHRRLEEPLKRHPRDRVGKHVGDEIEFQARDDAIEAEAQRIFGANLLHVRAALD